MELIHKITAFEKSDRYYTFFSDSEYLLKVTILDGIVNFRICKRESSKKHKSFIIDLGKFKISNSKITEDDYFFLISINNLKLKIFKHPFYIEILDDEGNILLSDFKDSAYFRKNNHMFLRKKVRTGERFFGFGEKVGNLNKRSSKMVMWNTDYLECGPKKYVSQDPLYISIPFFISVNDSHSYGFFYDNPGKLHFDMGKKDKNYYEIKAETGEIDYYFIYGNDIREIVSRYTELTGRMQMPPLWSLGYHQSRWGYKTQKEVLEIARKFRNKNIPCDCIHLDIDYMRGFGVFTWDRRRFPDPKKMIDKLKENGIKTTVIIDPGVKADDRYKIYKEGIRNDLFCKNKNGTVYHGKVWPGKTAFPDFFKQTTRRWWAESVKKFSSGIEGFWNDMNEPSNGGLKFKGFHYINNIKTEHKKVRNLYGYFMVKALYEGFLNEKERRKFVLTRSGFAGIQKYSAVWTGDIHSKWDDLRVSIPMMLNLGLSGVSFIGTDVGGFRANTSGELFIRWLQAGIFLPLLRNHSEKKTRNQEPWAFGKKTEKIAKKLIQFRYRIIPLLYSLIYESHKKGYPVIRPLFFHYPEDKNVYDIEDQFMVGETILVAPVLHSRKKDRKVYLPKGEWINYLNNKKYQGRRTNEFESKMDKVLFFIKKGAIIPFYDCLNYIGEKKYTKLYLNVYPGVGKFLYYEDDGETYNYEKGEYNTLKISQKTTDKSSVIEIKPEHLGYKSALKEISIKYFGKVNCINIEPEKNKMIKSFTCDLNSGISLIKIKYIYPFKSLRLIFDTVNKTKE